MERVNMYTVRTVIVRLSGARERIVLTKNILRKRWPRNVIKQGFHIIP